MTHFWNYLKSDIVPPRSEGQAKERLLYLDILKVLSAFLVVFYHYSFYSLDFGFETGRPYFPNVNRVIMSLAACSVPLFFLVNGTLMLSKQRPWQKVYYKAAKALVFIVFFRFLHFPSWFFKTLIILFLLYPIISCLWAKERRLYYLLTALLLIFPFIYNECVVISKLFCSNSLEVTGAKTLYSIVYFCLGNILIQKKDFRLLRSVFVSLSGLLLLLFDCVVLTNANQALADGVNDAFPTLGALLLAIGVFEAIRGMNISKSNAVLRFFSQGVLSIYLFHMTVCRALWLLIGFPTSLPGALLGTLTICTVCGAVGMILRRIPVLCFLTKL